MSINDLTFGEMKEIAAIFNGVQREPAHGAVGKKCVVRTFASGVHYGTVVSVSENGGRSRVELKCARRIYSWSGAFTLNAVASVGVDKSSKVSCSVNQIFIDDAIEFIPMTDEAVKCIDGIKDHAI